jgi:hypothetical protein
VETLAGGTLVGKTRVFCCPARDLSHANTKQDDSGQDLSRDSGEDVSRVDRQPNNRGDGTKRVLDPGDVLVAYTDGIPDTRDFNGRKFGKLRLREAVLSILAEQPDAPAGRILEHIFWELRQFAGILERPDDQTVVVLHDTGRTMAARVDGEDAHRGRQRELGPGSHRG